MKELAKRIKETRTYLGLSQKKMSDLVQLSMRTIANYEKDGTRITVETATDIARRCNINVVWLLTGQGTISDSAPGKAPSDPESIDELKQIIKKQDHQLSEMQKDMAWSVGVMKQYERAFTLFITLLDQAGVDTEDLRRMRDPKFPISDSKSKDAIESVRKVDNL